MKLHDVSKRYTRRGPLVLRNIDLDVSAGIVVHVKGDNGCGKSTLLRIVARVIAPSGGQVTGVPPQVGYVPERFPPGLPFTPLQYLAHLGRIRGLPRHLVVARGGDLLEQLDASSKADTPLSELSKGTCQKVAVAQALLGNPALLVLDEAFTGLDTHARAVLIEQLRARRGVGVAVVFTDHGQRARELTPDTTVLLTAGALTPVAPASRDEAMMFVVLAGRPERFDPARYDGVAHVEVSAQEMRLYVTSGSCDILLTAALAAGCSVRRVEGRR